MRKIVLCLLVLLSLLLSLWHFFTNKHQLLLVSNAFQIDYQTTKANLYPPQLARVANQVERGKLFKYYFFFEKNFTNIFDLSLFSSSYLGVIYLVIFLVAAVSIYKDSFVETFALTLFPVLVFTLVGTNLKGIEICFLPVIIFGISKNILFSK